MLARVIRIGVLSLSFGAWAFAQEEAGTTYPYDPVRLIPWSDQFLLALGEAYSRADHGDLNGDGLPDVVAVQDGQVVFICGPGNYESMHESTLPGTVADLAVARRGVAVDLLFTVGTSGLSVRPFNSATNGFLPPVTISGSWSSVDQLRAREAAGGIVTLCGVDEGGLTVRVVKYSPGTGLSQQNSFSVASPVIDMEVVRPPGGGTHRLALLRTNGVTFHDPLNPVPAISPIIRSAHPFGSLCAFPSTGGGDATAWVTLSPSGSQYLLLIIDTSGVVFGTVQLQLPPHPGQGSLPVNVQGLCSGDINGDGFTDLLITATETGADYVLWNGATAAEPSPSFSAAPGRFSLVDLAPGLLESTAGVDDATGMLVDLDLDGGLEFVRPCSMTGGLYVPPLVPMPEGLQGVPTDIIESSVGYDVPIYEVAATGDDGVLRLRLDLTGPDLAAATHLQAILWRHPDAATDTDATVLGDPHSNHAYRLVMGAGGPEPLQEIAIDVPESGVGGLNGNYYYVELHLISMPTESDLDAYTDLDGPLSTALYVSEDIPGWDDYMLNELALDGAPIAVDVQSSSGGGGELPGTALVGAVAPLVRLPRFRESDLPRPGKITEVKDATPPPQ